MRLKLNNKQEFKKIFDQFYSALYIFALKMVVDSNIAEDIVQEVFINLWQNPDDFENVYAINSYLYTSVKNKCINILEHEQVKKKHQEYSKSESIELAAFDNQIIEEETHRLIYNAINQLPSECKKILLLSLDGFKNNEIAEKLNISVNTVKTQKKIAYKQLRILLKDIYSVTGFLVVNIL